VTGPCGTVEHMTLRLRGAICVRMMHRRCPSGSWRAQGMPGAGCTRSLVC
jgi:hypothetical protein